MEFHTILLHVALYLVRGPCEKFVDWWHWAAVM